MCVFQHPVVIPIIEFLSVVIAAILAVRTLRAMKKQRETTYAPQLITSSVRFRLIKHEHMIVGTSSDITKIPDNTKVKDIKGYKIELYNIGLGTATDVKVQIDFPYEKAIDIIRSFYKNSNVDFNEKLEWSNSDHGDRILVTDNVTYHDWPSQKICDFLMPISQKNSCGHIHLPSHIEYLMFRHFVAQLETDNNSIDPQRSFPLIKLIVSYKDISNKTHKRVIKLKSEHGGGWNGCMWCGLEAVDDTWNKQDYF